MIAYPHIDPGLVRIGPFAVRWYGLMYLLGFGASYLLVRRSLRKNDWILGGKVLSPDFLPSFYTFLVLGLVIGARLGYVLFYDLREYLQRPWDVFAIWQGGMSFHGGLIGSVIAGLWCCRKFKADAWSAADLVIPTAPIGLGLGRLGNFINGELYGRVTDAPWGMVFPGGGPNPRHPSQLYEFLLEGAALFLILWLIKDRIRRRGVLFALFLVLYGAFRIFGEFFREPDPQIGFVLGFFTMGQVLSSILLFAGVAIMILMNRRRDA
jgi:phosphatidylglycerol:prolipoprotein diacylglycerol transferase